MTGYVPRPAAEDTWYLTDTPGGTAVLVLVTLVLGYAAWILGRLFYEHISANIAASRRADELAAARRSAAVEAGTDYVDDRLVDYAVARERWGR